MMIEKLKKVASRMTQIKKGDMKEECPIGIIDFEKWEWPQGVGLYGMFKFYKETGDKEYLECLIRWYETKFKEGLPEKNVNTMAPMLALAHIYEETKNKKYLDICNEWAEWVMREMPRTEEGVLQHIVTGELNPQQVWDDTLYMTVLFLAKMGKLLNNDEYIQESIYQFMTHIKYLYDTKTGLWFHGWTFIERDNFAKALWARGNCWITAGIPDYIEMMEIEGATKRYLIQTLEAQIKKLAELQNENGLWHTLLDDNTSYLETSATAGFGYGILKAVRLGYIDVKYLETGKKAIQGVLKYIGEDGTVEQVSYGTGMGRDLEHYKNIPICPMPYGQSLTILLLNEALKL